MTRSTYGLTFAYGEAIDIETLEFKSQSLALVVARMLADDPKCLSVSVEDPQELVIFSSPAQWNIASR